MEPGNYDIKADALFNAVGYVEKLGEYNGEYTQEAFNLLKIDDLGVTGWCDLMVADDGKVYAVASEEEGTQFGEFFFKEIVFDDLPKSAKRVVAKKMIKDFEDDVESQLQEIAKNACDGLQGWYVPVIAKIKAGNRIQLYAGGQVSRGTQLVSNDSRERCVGMMETWTPTYGRDDAERWARDCNTDPTDFDYDEEVSNDIHYNLDYFTLSNEVMEDLKEWLLME